MSDHEDTFYDAVSDDLTSPAVPTPPAPKGFVGHLFARHFTVPAPRAQVWAWLSKTETFTEGHPPGYAVEFVEDRFAPGVHTLHTGPFLHLPGVIGEMQPARFRDLRYFYGAYVLSVWLIRPVRLQLWVDDDHTPGHSRVHLQLHSHVRPAMASLWTAAQTVFWGIFGRDMARSIPAHR